MNYKILIFISLICLSLLSVLQVITVEELQLKQEVIIEEMRLENEELEAEIEELNYKVDRYEESVVEYSEKAEEIISRANNSRKEIELLARIIQAEANNQCVEGKYAVACVVMNRVDSELFPETLTEVVYAKNQFPSVRSKLFNSPITEEHLTIAREVYYGKRDIPKNVLFFKATYSTQTWNYELWRVIGVHEFYFR